MQTLNLQQGSDDWLAVRCQHFTASEAPVMMGVSKHLSRDELLAEKATGVPGEISYFTQKLFDKGHEAEDSARPHIENLIKDDLYPTVGVAEIDGISLLASFDGMTMMEDIDFEHKLWNDALVKAIENQELPDEYAYQLEQQLMVSGAEKAMFVCSDGIPDKLAYMWYYPNPDKQKELIAGWKQFKNDLIDFELQDKPQPKAQAKQIEGLPTLFVDITGQVNETNISIVESSAIEFVRSIKKDLQTDQDFANAEQQVKFCKKAEDQLKLVKKQALSKTADIEKLFFTVDKINDELRTTRLALDKQVKEQKQTRKQSIVMQTIGDYKQYVNTVNNNLGDQYLQPTFDFRDSGKGKRTLESFKNALNNALAKAKIEITERSEVAHKNKLFIEKNTDCRYLSLFPDMRQIALKQHDDFFVLVKSRINEHKKNELMRQEKEREKMRLEEERKAREKVEREQRQVKLEQQKKERERLEKQKAEEAIKAREEQELKDKEERKAKEENDRLAKENQADLAVKEDIEEIISDKGDLESVVEKTIGKIEEDPITEMEYMECIADSIVTCQKLFIFLLDNTERVGVNPKEEDAIKHLLEFSKNIGN
jgi:predicted phage-related endonuclease